MFSDKSLEIQDNSEAHQANKKMKNKPNIVRALQIHDIGNVKITKNDSKPNVQK